MRELKKPRVFEEQDKERIKNLSLKGNGYRGLRDDITKAFGVRYEYDETTGKVAKQYYPTTIASDLSGYKVRYEPKDFRCIGECGKQCDLFMQFKFKKAGKYVLIVGGELDSLSAFQMLKDYQEERKSDYDPIPVVSPTTGENSVEQIKRQYEWLNRFERIIIGLDNDAAGKAATEALIAALPRGKVWVVEWSLKDPNLMLTEGRSKDFIRDFYNARRVLSASILESKGIADKMLEAAAKPKIPLPPFMRDVQNMLRGGLPASGIVNLGAASGIGKTTVVNQILHFWFFNAEVRAGIVSMELDAGEYGLVLLSHHIKQKLDDLSVDERLRLLESPEIIAQRNTLLYREDGDSRFLLMDDRDGSVEAIQAVVEEMVVAGDCKLIILDPLQDILDGMTNEDQAVFLRWQKGLVKSHGVLFVNINHIRKAQDSKQAGSKGAFITEEDFAGSSTIFKSASVNILISRNKYAEDELEKNTTTVFVSKNRQGGRTGPAGQWIYCHKTHTLYDKDYYIEHIVEADI